MILMLAVALYPLLFQQRYSPLSLRFTFFSSKVTFVSQWPVFKGRDAWRITIDVSVMSWGTVDPGFILNHFTPPWWYPLQTTVTLSFTSKGPWIQGGMVWTLTCTWKSAKKIWEKKSMRVQLRSDIIPWILWCSWRKACAVSSPCKP